MFYLSRNQSIDLDFKSTDWFLHALYIQNLHSQLYFKIGVLKNFAIFTAINLCWSLQHRYFSLNTWKFLRTLFKKNTSGGSFRKEGHTIWKDIHIKNRGRKTISSRSLNWVVTFLNCLLLEISVVNRVSLLSQKPTYILH